MLKKLLLVGLLSAGLFGVSNNIRNASDIVVNISSKFSTGNNQKPFNFEPFFGNYYNPKFTGLSLDRLKRVLGSGIIIGSDGYILTNYHVIEKAEAVTVKLSTGENEITAKVIGIDHINDLAVLKIERENLPSFFYGKSANVENGDGVYVLANPYGKEPFITKATVSYVIRDGSIDRNIKYIQANGSIHPAATGGALVDENGRFLGLVNGEDTKELGLKGYFISTPIGTIKESVTKILENERRDPVWLGISIGSIDRELADYYNRKNGVVIKSVEDNSPAFKGGLRKGDLIISVDDVPVDDISDMNYRIATMRPGDVKLIEFQRDRAIEETVVTMEKLFGSGDESIGGVTIKGLVVEPLTRKLRRTLGIDHDFKGVVVTTMTGGSSAYKAGFMKNDVLIRVDNKEISSIDNLKLLMTPSTQTFTVFRKGIIKAVVWEKNE